jgi:hypothetical protein
MTVHLSARAASQIGITGSRGNKYGAVRTNGFDSKREAKRWNDLLALRGAGLIHDLRRQPEFHVWIGAQLVCTYRADFMFEQDGALVIEDSKGFRTPTYRLKKKLVEAVFGVEVIES